MPAINIPGDIYTENVHILSEHTMSNFDWAGMTSSQTIRIDLVKTSWF